MVISEDTTAIVAAQLASAHCAAGAKFSSEVADLELAHFIAGVYAGYQRFLKDGTLNHFAQNSSA